MGAAGARSRSRVGFGAARLGGVARAVLYTWSSCGFCARAKALLDAHGVSWEERVLDGDRGRAEQLARAFGLATMPYVLLDGELVGGLAELEALAERGGLG